MIQKVFLWRKTNCVFFLSGSTHADGKETVIFSDTYFRRALRGGKSWAQKLKT